MQIDPTSRDLRPRLGGKKEEENNHEISSE